MMAYRLEERGILAVSIILIASIRITLATDPDGFLSIDCGGSQHIDNGTQLSWISDEDILGGPRGLIGVVPYPVNSYRDNSVALQTFRYFVSEDTKYCYNNISVALRNASASVLLRAMFLHGDSPNLTLPISFDVYVNASLWDSIEYTSYESVSALREPRVLEGIFFFGDSNTTINVCLVPRQGTPFISSLELRELDGNMYPFSNTTDRKDIFLSSLFRWDLGVTELHGCPQTITTSRYPSDPYDRLWLCLHFAPEELTGEDFLSSTSIAQPLVAGEVAENFVPGNVMATGVTLSPRARLRNFTSFTLTLQLPAVSVSAYAIFYFRDVMSQNGSLLMNSSFQDAVSSNFLVQGESVVSRTYEDSLISSNTAIMSFGSSGPDSPLVNAVEIYEKKVVDHYITEPQNVKLIDLLTREFNLPWEGDPCIPVPHEMITCTPSHNLSVWVNIRKFGPRSRASYITYLRSITLSYLTNTLRLKDITKLDSFKLILLESLNCIHSDLDDQTLQYFLRLTGNSTSNLAYIKQLDVTNNSISQFSEDLIMSNPLISSLNLSQNYFIGEAPSFGGLVPIYTKPSGNNIRTLNMSHNKLNAFPRSWERTPILDYPVLNVLDFSHNELTDFSSLQKFVHRNSSYLHRVHLSNNSFTGSFPQDLYFSNSSLRTLILDHNRLQGTLNLSNWQSKMGIFLNNQFVSADTMMSPNKMILSLVNNSITDIYPDITLLQTFIDKLSRSPLSNGSGILLGGNPYCKVAGKGATHQQQRYLCRYAIDDVLHDSKKKKSNVLLVVGSILGGVFAIVICSIFLIIIIRLQKKIQSLNKFQLELAERRVQPPLYSYQDLRAATKDFHEDRKLGRGAFGAVYKGQLRDGSLVAVKVLFSNDKLDKPQLMDQFLNEVVLITGIKHKHLVQLQGCCIYGKKKILVYEFAENGDLADSLWGKQSKMCMLSWNDRRNVCIGVARGLSYLHEELQPRIIHRDIKAANVLLDHNLNSKIADFGLAKPFEEEETRAQFTHVAGTRGYWAPEYVLDGQLTQKADVYSFGILVLEIVSGRPCVVTSLSDEEISLKNWAEILYSQDRSLELLQPELREACSHDEVKRVIETALRCLKSNPKQRPTMSAVVFMLLHEGADEHGTTTQMWSEKDDLQRSRRGRAAGHGLLQEIGRDEDSEGSDWSPLISSSRRSSMLDLASFGTNEIGQSSSVTGPQLSEESRELGR